MLTLLKRIFSRKSRLQSGGNGCCDVLDPLGRVLGQVYYSRPTSEMRRDYLYNLHNSLCTESNLNEVSKAALKAKAVHDVLVHEITIPYAEKIFISCSGFEKENGTTLDSATQAEQFDVLKKYHDHVLSRLVDIAYSVSTTLKKKN